MCKIFFPYFDPTLERGLWVWTNYFYNEHQNFLYYQLQCVLGKEDSDSDSNLLLFEISYLLSSQLLFVSEGDFNFAE